MWIALLVLIALLVRFGASRAIAAPAPIGARVLAVTKWMDYPLVTVMRHPWVWRDIRGVRRQVAPIVWMAGLLTIVSVVAGPCGA